MAVDVTHRSSAAVFSLAGWTTNLTLLLKSSWGCVSPVSDVRLICASVMINPASRPSPRVLRPSSRARGRLWSYRQRWWWWWLSQCRLASHRSWVRLRPEAFQCGLCMCLCGVSAGPVSVYWGVSVLTSWWAATQPGCDLARALGKMWDKKGWPDVQRCTNQSLTVQCFFGECRRFFLLLIIQWNSGCVFFLFEHMRWRAIKCVPVADHILCLYVKSCIEGLILRWLDLLLQCSKLRFWCKESNAKSSPEPKDENYSQQKGDSVWLVIVMIVAAGEKNSFLRGYSGLGFLKLFLPLLISWTR